MFIFTKFKKINANNITFHYFFRYPIKSAMKPFLTIIHFWAICCLLTFSASANPLHLLDAQSQKKVQYTISPNDGSTHYLEPLKMSVQNLANENLQILVSNGDICIPSDAQVQNIVITEQELITLKPKEKKEIALKGMCIEQSDRASGLNVLYTLKKNNDQKLLQLTQFLESKKLQTSAAQYAVWALVDSGDINTIFAADTAEENSLKRFMAQLTGRTFSVTNKNDYRTNYYAPPKERVGGNFEYSFTQTKDVQIAMFDANGILVRELFNQKNVAPGPHKLNFEYDSSVYTDDVYFFKLIVNNQVMVNRKWDVKAMRDSFKKKWQESQGQ